MDFFHSSELQNTDEAYMVSEFPLRLEKHTDFCAARPELRFTLHTISYVISRWNQGNFTTVLAVGSNPPRLGPWVLISAFYAGEFLCQSCDDVGCFHANKLLRRACPRPPTERNKSPQRLKPFPTLRTELVGIRTPDILVLM